MGLRDKYAYAISQAKGKFDGSAQERDGKLYFTGSVKTENEKNEIWTAIKTYTVKAGDTLSAIAKAELGSANAYMKIFEANRDQLSDPDKIKPGQVLKIPA